MANVMGTPLNALVEPYFGPNDVTPAGGVICTVNGIGSVVETVPDCPLPLALPSVTFTADAVKSCVRLPAKVEARIVAVPAEFPKVSKIWASPLTSLVLLEADNVAGPDSTLQVMVWPEIGAPKPSRSLTIRGLLISEPSTPCWASPDCFVNVDAGTGLMT